MTLATHIVAGAAAAKVFATDPVQAFIIGWISHYVLDTITHWDYPMKTFTWNRADPRQNKIRFSKDLIWDISKVVLDVVIGFAIVAAVYAGFDFSKLGTEEAKLILAGAIGGVMPDFIQFLYAIFKVKLFRIFQNFHDFVHADSDFNNRPLIGIASQILIILVIAAFI